MKQVVTHAQREHGAAEVTPELAKVNAGITQR